mgnify:CR=1 FL=1
MSAITAKASRKMKKYAVLTREPRCFLGSFDFSWEQRKLGEMGQTYTGLSGKTKDDFGHGQARFVTYMNVFSNPISNPEMTEPIEIDPKQNEVEVGDVFFTTSSETPEEVGMSSILLEKRGKTYLNSFCFGFRPSEKIDSYYLAYMLRSESTRAKIILLAQGISRYNISKNKVMEIAVSLPSLDEQKMIGQYFSQLDNLITLHQRKCANLCSPSQVVFSLLFATSTFSWEQRKLGEIGSVSMCRRIFKEQTSETGDIPFYKIGTFGADPDAFISRELFEEYKSKYPYPQKGDILISASGSIGRTVEFAGNNEYFQDSNIVWLNHDERLSNPFLKCFYSVVKWAGIEGSTIKRLYNDNILNTVICMPSVPEQKRIGLFFENLDNLITLHQRECISFTGRADRLILTANKKRTTSSWEQRKLGDIADIVGGGTPSTGNQSYWDGDIDWYAPAEIADQIYANSSQKKITGLGYENSSAKMLPPGTVLFTSRAGIGKTAILTRKGCTNQGFQSIVPHRGELDSYFIFSRTEELKRYGELVGAGSTFVEVSGKQMAVMELMMPPTMREQQTIGGFFQQLDHLITLHQRKPFLMKWRTSDANRNQTNRLVL